MQAHPWETGAPVRGYHWAAETPRGAVLLTHGFGEYAGRYVERYHRLIPSLVGAGYSVYATDQRSHGHSAGRKAVVNVATLVEDHLLAREALRPLRVPVFAFGHSMGGLITAASVARDPRGLRGVVLSSPALLIGENEPAWLKKLAPVLAKIAPGAPATDLGTGGLSRLPEEVAAYEADGAMYHGKVPALTAASMLALSTSLWPLYGNWSLPTLVLHGSEDKLTDPRGSQRFIGAIASADKTLLLEQGGYHELLNDEPREQIRARLLDWLQAHTP